MGNCFGFRRRRIRRRIVLILIGLDNAGKTNTVNNLAGENDDKVLPTVGFKAVNLIHKDTPVTIYDLGGGPRFRQIWPQYYSEVHGVIFVIDSSDLSRLDECKAVLEEVLSHDKISGKPVLVLANKQDKRGALDDIDVVDELSIEPLVNKYRCPTLVESYSARPQDADCKKPKIDPGLRKGYHWLLNYIVRRYGDLNLRVQTDIHAELERRKRLQRRAAHRASQTSTAASDDIATQTGFGNPAFEAREAREARQARQARSEDTTATLESADDSDGAGDAASAPAPPPKLSPVARRSAANRIDFENGPGSRNKACASSDSSSLEGPRARALPHRVLVGDAERGALQRELVLTDRAPASRPSGAEARPASASQLLRRQLQLPAHHKRRLSLRHVQRNKTSPERSSVLLYEPKARRHLDKGDFEHATVGT